MKRLIIITMMFFSLLSIQAESVSDIFRDFSYAKRVEKVNLNRFVMSLFRPFINSHEYNGLKVKSLQVLDLSDCDSYVKEEFSERVRFVDDELYETLVQVKEDDQFVKIIAKNHDDYFSEIVILVTGDDAAYVRIKGNFSLNDVQNLAYKN